MIFIYGGKVFPEKGSACDEALAAAIRALIPITVIAVTAGVLVLLYLTFSGELINILLAV